MGPFPPWAAMQDFGSSPGSGRLSDLQRVENWGLGLGIPREENGEWLRAGIPCSKEDLHGGSELGIPLCPSSDGELRG